MCFIDIQKLPKFAYNNITYIQWYKDNLCNICFSEMPDIGNKEINNQIMTKSEIKQAKKKPLYLKNTVSFLLQDLTKNKTYTFTVNKHYAYDGATILKFFWRVIGTKEDIRFKIAALIHDVLCENHSYVDNDRYFADKVFERSLYVGDTAAFIRWLMFHSVDNFQKFCGWRAEAEGACEEQDPQRRLTPAAQDSGWEG
ncbi:MAG: DUF1353 domain-containing protein [Candidatus Gastranaerophilales bacterium]|nr:DUF1353 domain-containing protein [Candidatus Gastranaerophilales bacterium]